MARGEMGGSYTMKTSFDYVPEMAKSELYLEFKATIGKKVVTIPAVKIADGVISTSELVNNTLGNANPALGEDAFHFKTGVTSTTAFLLKYFSGNLPLMVAGTLPPTASNTCGVTVK